MTQMTVCRNHNHVLYSFMTYRRVCFKRNPTGAFKRAGTAHPSGTPEFTTGFSSIRVAQYLVFYVMFCRSLFIILSFIFGDCIFCTL